VFDGESLAEPAQVKSVTSAQTGPIADLELTSFEYSKGWQHATDQRTAPGHTRVGASGVRREGGVSVWEHEEERKKTRGRAGVL
jgi:hypothetical protein